MVDNNTFEKNAYKWLNENQLSYDIWENKYRNSYETLDEWFKRVSGNDPETEKLIREKKFLFGGRILASRGVTDRKVTYSNCYVITPPEDNLESIFECASKLARTYSYGGGCGVDISKLAPRGATIHNAARSTSGAISFMDFYSYVTGLIGQEGRRGALMLSIDCRHPDLEEFINLKTKPDICTKANISVRVSDEFMRAVEEDKDWNMEYYRPESDEFITKTAKARDLFKLLAQRNWEWAEPGILYWDRISQYNLLEGTSFSYAGVNPCAEEPLPPGGSCLLGSINLSEFVYNPYLNTATFAEKEFRDAVRLSVLALNKVLNEGLELHPLQEQRDSVRKWRQIGLGTFGLHDLLLKLGIKYGSEESIMIIQNIYKLMAQEAVCQSLELAKVYGCYEECDKDKLASCQFIKNLELNPKIIEEIKEYGLYNSQLLTCAPTGSTATMLECSTGVEPYFALFYTRKTQSLHGKDTYYQVSTRIVEDYKRTTGDVKLPNYFVTSADIQPIDRIKIQAELQKYIDASISSTINLPEEATIDDIYNIYLEAWRHGLKGVTIYRNNCLRSGILTVGPQKETQTMVAKKRPKELEADFHLVKANGEQFIVLVGLLDNKPYEVFAFKPNLQVNLPNHKGVITKESKMHYKFASDNVVIPELELTNINVEERATTLYASMLLRHNVDIKYIIKTAKKVNSNITSFTSAVCRVLSKYMIKEVTGEKCPECGADIIKEGGCEHCSQCEWSRCE